VIDDRDVDAVAAQLGRSPRGMRAVAHRCPCGLPDVVETSPRLEDGTPFPTLYYLTCPRAASSIGRLEASGLMRELTARLSSDPVLAERYEAAHRDYLARREAIGEVPEIAGVSAGGMPDRVKCLHVLVGQALACGPGVNPLGDEALGLLPDWWAGGPCVPAPLPGDHGVVSRSPQGEGALGEGAVSFALLADTPAAQRTPHTPRPPAAGGSAVRVAAIDCGTNSIRLLVADLDPAGGRLVDLDRRMEIVRLGQGVDRTGRLAPDALQRTFAACRHYADAIRRHGAERVRFVATSATRDADNRADFVAGVLDIIGAAPEVVTGDEEAALSFTGATRELADTDVATPCLVVDIGGGSTEFVLGSDTVIAARSVDIGCVRLTERHLRADPPTAEQVTAAVADIDAAIEQVAEVVPLAKARSLVGLAGSVTTVAGIALDLPEYDSERIHHSRIPAAHVHAVTDRLLASTHDERARIPVMHPGRVDVIGAGALILRRVLDRLELPEVVVSEHDILDGIAWSLVD
jgi:hypothetical protein